MSVQTITRDPPVESAMPESGITCRSRTWALSAERDDPHPQVEEKSAQLYSAMKIRGFLHLYNGEEAVGVGVFRR